jgi:hypothetical protein
VVVALFWKQFRKSFTLWNRFLSDCDPLDAKSPGINYQCKDFQDQFPQLSRSLTAMEEALTKRTVGCADIPNLYKTILFLITLKLINSIAWYCWCFQSFFSYSHFCFCLTLFSSVCRLLDNSFISFINLLISSQLAKQAIQWKPSRSGASYPVKTFNVSLKLASRSPSRRASRSDSNSFSISPPPSFTPLGSPTPPQNLTITIWPPLSVYRPSRSLKMHTQVPHPKPYRDPGSRSSLFSRTRFSGQLFHGTHELQPASSNRP